MREAFQKLRPPAQKTLSLVLTGVAALAAPQAWAATTPTGFNVDAGGVAYNAVVNQRVMEALTELPGATGGPAYGINGARIQPDDFGDGEGDAFDGFGGISVNGVSFNQPGDRVDRVTTPGGVRVDTLRPAATGGVDASLDYFFDASSPTLRVLGTFTNATADAADAAVAYGGELGSDSFTTILTTRSGDAAWDVAGDGWAITSDVDADAIAGGFTDPIDPVLTFARFEPGAAVVASASPNIPGEDTPFFGPSDRLTDVFTLALAAGETQRLLFYVQLNPDQASAIAGASTFTSLDTLNAAGLLEGLGAEALGQVVNWAPLQPIPEPGTLALVAAGAGLALGRRRSAPRA